MGMIRAPDRPAGPPRMPNRGEVIDGVDQESGRARGQIKRRIRFVNLIARSEEQAATFVREFASGMSDDRVNDRSTDSHMGHFARLSTIIAVPMPPPMHRGAAPRPPPRA